MNTSLQKAAQHSAAQAVLSRRERVQKQLAQARATLATLTRERDEVVNGYANDPTKSPAMLDDIGSEISAAERRVAELVAALEIAAEFDGADHRAGLRRTVRKAHDTLQHNTKKRIAMAADIDRTIGDLGKLLAAWCELGESIAADAKVVTSTAAEDFKLRDRYAGADTIALAAGTSMLFGSAVVEQLARAGLFRDGSIPHPANIAPDLTIYAARGGMGLEQAATIAHDKLAGVMDRFETLADATLGALED